MNRIRLEFRKTASRPDGTTLDDVHVDRSGGARRPDEAEGSKVEAWEDSGRSVSEPGAQACPRGASLKNHPIPEPRDVEACSMRGDVANELFTTVRAVKMDRLMQVLGLAGSSSL